MSVTFLSGGTGTPKLLDGARQEVDEFTVVCNTGDDVVISGNLVAPDVDSVLYTLAGEIDRTTWWGREDDSFHTHEALTADGQKVVRVESQRPLGMERAFGGDGEFMRIGDRDRALHVVRTSAVDSGGSLTEAVQRCADWLDVDERFTVLPMSGEAVASYVHTPEGPMHFQRWWVMEDGEPPVEDVDFRGAGRAKPTDEVFSALQDPVVVGPSNPVTSLGPMLSLPGFRDALQQTPVAAVSPFVGGDVVSGPAAELMEAVGLEPSTRGVCHAYEEFLDVLVVDESEEELEVDCQVVSSDTLLDGRGDAYRLTREILAALEDLDEPV